jgi:hypothetical protein
LPKFKKAKPCMQCSVMQGKAKPMAMPIERHKLISRARASQNIEKKGLSIISALQYWPTLHAHVHAQHDTARPLLVRIDEFTEDGAQLIRSHNSIRKQCAHSERVRKKLIKNLTDGAENCRGRGR